jgi:hypothetical protein
MFLTSVPDGPARELASSNSSLFIPEVELNWALLFPICYTMKRNGERHFFGKFAPKAEKEKVDPLFWLPHGLL